MTVACNISSCVHQHSNREGGGSSCAPHTPHWKRRRDLATMCTASCSSAWNYGVTNQIWDFDFIVWQNLTCGTQAHTLVLGHAIFMVVSDVTLMCVSCDDWLTVLMVNRPLFPSQRRGVVWGLEGYIPPPSSLADQPLHKRRRNLANLHHEFVLQSQQWTNNTRCNQCWLW